MYRVLFYKHIILIRTFCIRDFFRIYYKLGASNKADKKMFIAHNINSQSLTLHDENTRWRLHPHWMPRFFTLL